VVRYINKIIFKIYMMSPPTLTMVQSKYGNRYTEAAKQYILYKYTSTAWANSGL
jgi:hypothetical protein